MSMRASAILAIGAGVLLLSAPAQQKSTLTVRVLTKEVRTLNGVQTTEWLPGAGYRVQVGDAGNPVRYCNELHQDPPAKVECAVPYRTRTTVRIEKQGSARQCAEPVTIAEGTKVSITARLDDRAISCRSTRS